MFYINPIITQIKERNITIMDKIFAEMFAKQPDEIMEGVYYYNNSWWIDLEEKIAPEILSLSIEEIRKQREQNWLGAFRHHWETRTSQGEFNTLTDAPWLQYFKGKEKIIEFEQIINKIALENKPFMDIASCEGMGFVPFIVKKNPKIPCLVTDIDGHLIKCLHSYIDNNLAEYYINLASFDNSNIPIKDESLDYITSNLGITSSGINSTARPQKNIFDPSFNKEKVIDEVYRILKPSGFFITFELSREFSFDLQKIYNDFNEYGKLFGIYTYDEIQAVLRLLDGDQWRNKFIMAGFQVEVEKKFPWKYSVDEIKRLLYFYTSENEIHKWTDEERALYSISKNKRYIKSTQTLLNSLKDEILLRKINLMEHLNFKKRLLPDEIKDILCKMVESNETNSFINKIDNKNDADAENIGIDGVEILYILRK